MIIDYINFVRGNGITAIALPDNSPEITNSYAVAIEIVPIIIKTMGFTNTYDRLLLLYAMHTMIVQGGSSDNPAISTLFDSLKGKATDMQSIAGFVTEASDVSTTGRKDYLDAYKNMALGKTSLMSTPFGTEYLLLMEQFAPFINYGLTI